MNSDKLRITMKAFIESQFSYCPLIWMFHDRTLNNNINRLHKRSLRLVYKEPHFTFEEHLKKDKSFCIHHRNLQKLATEMYKTLNNISPIFMKEVLPEREMSYALRKNNPFQSRNVNSVYNGTETLSFRGSKTWEMVPTDIKKSKSLKEFKAKIKNWKP